MSTNIAAHLRGFQLDDILQIIGVGKKTGIATFIHHGAAAKLVFRSGRIVYASSDTQDRLGYSLVKRRIISEDDLAKALELQKDGSVPMPLASVLVKQGVVYPEILEKETAKHIRRVFADVLTWDGGIFYFEPDEISSSMTIIRDGLSVESLLIEAALHRDADVRTDREICEFWPQSSTHHPSTTTQSHHGDETHEDS
ncbi:MAG: DUF4388 domain-containing protein [Planctomycetota bacterium]